MLLLCLFLSAAGGDPDEAPRSAGGAVQRAPAGDTRPETKGVINRPFFAAVV